MQGKIALEEHFAMDDTVQDSAGFAPALDWIELKARLLDIHERRLAEMDAHGIELMLLSLNAPAVQAIPDRDRALDLSRRANDFLAEQVARRPDRFQGLAALPMQDPEAAARELDRCVSDARISRRAGQRLQRAHWDRSRHLLRSQGVLAVLGGGRASRRSLLPASAQSAARRMRRSTRDIAGCWGRPGRSGRRPRCTRLRLMGSGLFDAYPRLQIILGHMGEGLPYSMWRVDNHNKWMRTAERLSGASARSRTISGRTSTSPRRAISAPRR